MMERGVSTATLGATDGMGNEDCPFTVKISVLDQNIRQGERMDTAKAGKTEVRDWID